MSKLLLSLAGCLLLCLVVVFIARQLQDYGNHPYKLTSTVSGKSYTFHCPLAWVANPIAWTEDERFIVALGGDTFFYEVPRTTPDYYESECKR